MFSQRSGIWEGQLTVSTGRHLLMEHFAQPIFWRLRFSCAKVVGRMGPTMFFLRVRDDSGECARELNQPYDI